jgi:hypothetical protein
MTNRSPPTVREQMASQHGGHWAIPFAEWLRELRIEAGAYRLDMGADEDWRGYYDDAYSPSDALHEMLDNE